MEKAKAINDLVEKKGKCDETLKAVGPFTLFMPVVKLNNGDVLLYCPVRVSWYLYIYTYWMVQIKVYDRVCSLNSKPTHLLRLIGKNFNL